MDDSWRSRPPKQHSEVILSGTRGILLSSPYLPQGNLGAGFGIINSEKIAEELRFGLLYWDVVAVATTSTYHIPIEHEDMLLHEGYVLRPKVHLSDTNQNYDQMAELFARTFDIMESKEPGTWALAQRDLATLHALSIAEAARGVLVALYRALPVPVHTVPIDRIIEFRLRRQAELKRLRASIDGIYAAIAASDDSAYTLKARALEIEICCEDLIKTSREWFTGFKLADLNAVFNMTALTAAAEYGFMAQMPGISTLIGGATATVRIIRDYGLRKRSIRESPYWYSADFHNQVIFK